MPPRCGAVPPALLPGRADGDNGTWAAACGDTRNGDPLGNNDATATAIAGKVNNMGQENDDPGGNNRDKDKDNNK